MYLNLISHVSCVDLCIYRLWIWKGVKRTYTRLSKSYLILLSADNVITKIPIKTHGTIEYRLTGSTYNFFLEQQQQDSGPIFISSIITNYYDDSSNVMYIFFDHIPVTKSWKMTVINCEQIFGSNESQYNWLSQG